MKQRKSVLALIPARAGSKGVPGKNIRPLAGRPLVEYACRCGLGCAAVDRTIVSTDCPKIANAARHCGAEVPFLRPAELATDECPTADVIGHAIQWLRDHEQWTSDVVILLQPTAPLRTAADVQQALGMLATTDADSVVSVCPVPAHHHPRWQFRIDGVRLVPFAGTSLDSVPRRRQSLSPTYTRNGAIYAFRREVFESTGSFYGQRCAALVMPTERSVNIDTLADWHLAEAQLHHMEKTREAS